MHAIQPNYFDTAESYFARELWSEQDPAVKNNPLYPFFGHPDASGLSLSEVLYTARGSQGLGTQGLTEDRYQAYVLRDSARLEEDKMGTVLMVISFETEM